MSIRTVVEFNHDYVARMHENGDISERLYRWLLANYTKSRHEGEVQGVRILGTRHHSETLALKVQ